MNLEPANDRGFLLGEFSDRYGQKCSIQESSLATEACIWLGVNEVELKVLVPGKGWTDVVVPEGTTKSARMHLTRKMVKDLLPTLQHFVNTGGLPGPGDKLLDKPAVLEQCPEQVELYEHVYQCECIKDHDGQCKTTSAVKDVAEKNYNADYACDVMWTPKKKPEEQA